MNLTASQLADDLGRRSRMLNAFGPSGDGNAMADAAQCINSLRWLVAELADLTHGLVEALETTGALDTDSRAVWQDMAAHAQAAIR